MSQPDQIESALVLSLRSPLKWQSALTAPASGTLSPVVPASAFNAADYQQRDRELQYRDLIIGSAILDTALEVADIWHYLPDHPTLQGPAIPTLPLAASEITNSGSIGWVRHVKNVSIPWDAARYADADLYGRDTLLFEVLARACQIFASPPIQPADPSAVTVRAAGSLAWSLAEASATPADVSINLPLNRDLFKKPDQLLADRDNQLAAYVSRMAQVLKNPFEYALRLYVAVEGSSEREPEVYALTEDDGATRTWKAEPALLDRNTFVYDISNKTLQWVREQVDEVHVPQLYALSIPGIEIGQTLTTLAQVPEGKDAQFWRQKAGQLQPEGAQISDTSVYLERTDSNVTIGGVMQVDAASLTVPGNSLTFQMSGSVPAGNTRLAVLVEPNSTVEIIGGQNISDTTGTLGGASYAVSVPSGSISGDSYLVEGGDGIVYQSGTHAPGAVFSAISGGTLYSQVNGAFPSTVRQYALTFSLPLPAGAWKFKFDYSNISGTNTTGFGVKTEYAATGQSVLDIMQDTAPLLWSGLNGNTVTSSEVDFNVANNDPFRLNLLWTYGDGQFHVRRVYFNNVTQSTGSYSLVATVGTLTSANVSGLNKLPEVILFDGSFGAVAVNPAVSISYAHASSLPIRFNQVQFQSFGTYTNTPAASRFQGWRQECLDRAERAIQAGYNATLLEFTAAGSTIPTFHDSGAGWSADATDGWMGFVEFKNPRLREVPDIGNSDITVGRQYEVTTGPVTYGGTVYAAGDKFYGVYSAGSDYTSGEVRQVGAFKKSRPGHVGRPALVPAGLYIGSTGSVRASLNTPLSLPMLVACQPWMIDHGVYVAQEEFWMPEWIQSVTVVTPSTGTTATPPLPPPP